MGGKVLEKEEIIFVPVGKEGKCRARGRGKRGSKRRGLPGKVVAPCGWRTPTTTTKLGQPRWNSCACNLSEDEHRSAELQASFRNNGLPPPSSPDDTLVRYSGGNSKTGRKTRYLIEEGKEKKEKSESKSLHRARSTCLLACLLARFRGGAPPRSRSVMNFKRNRFIISLVPISRDQSPAPQVY